ncbi:hypothetical protein [Streptomyces sp. NBC_00525]|uniref:hypothetical protein n=1 Tax=Streptomyces sp. NBC_00525 TaxID=2903660 RepID=UPI002E81D4DD|nr:hypothetical protein [Streptomyces sp. NBC_00525]WUC92220.1 hypothetical protein OG710_00755 [Streptomyces sp. NBC_00525]
MSVLAALLDRSVVQIAEAAADVRRYDRETIHSVANVWDNNLFPLFWAAHSADADERERRARTVLEWMAGWGERRRGWMREQAGVAGYGVESLLSAVEPLRPGRDYLGRVMAPLYPVTRRTVDELLPDYDLGAAAVRSLRVERAGAGLYGFLELAVPRRFDVAEETPVSPALLHVPLDGVTDVVFDSSDAHGVALEPLVDGVEVRIGAGGRLRAASGECRWDDRCWYLSAAGRRADAVVPPRDGRSKRSEPPGGELGADARVAALLLRDAIWEIRSVRYPDRADRVPVLDLCRVFEGAGSAIAAAGSTPGVRARETAFRDLVRGWADRGGPVPARWFAAVLQRSGRSDLIDAPPAPAASPLPLTGERPSAPPAQAVLVMAAWTAAHSDPNRGRPATAQLQLALPPRHEAGPSSPWRLRTLGCDEPGAFRLRSAAFAGPGPLSLTGRATAASGVGLHDGALFVTSGEGWSASVS